MNAAIDIGNTKVKLGIFEDEKLVSFETFNSLEDLSIEIKKKDIAKIIVSSVRESNDFISEILRLDNEVVFLDFNTPLPFINHYQSPTLGLDRIAVVAGAQALFPHKNSLVIDMGTCITYEIIEGGKHYYGGAISPGMHMRFKSLHNFTARLPLVTVEHPIEQVGKTTEKSIQSGVVHGVIGEMEAFIQTYKEKYSPLNVIITGGDAKYFESKIKATIFAIPELVLVGLNAILRHNASI
ncbi:type III pantothenate kinase [Marivirga sp. S37H4]|uniref:Type III pantothenate kinase n=1 Tax=Marivirga aurantiaca TaxID=2802615 RepID=A0A934WYK2_9BACT|nr:type III pantothenate kinase [Marivirga aurantiaca]MBK6265553.1 type III pantothenate kinase [Marivirga aurantiaca]